MGSTFFPAVLLLATAIATVVAESRNHLDIPIQSVEATKRKRSEEAATNKTTNGCKKRWERSVIGSVTDFIFGRRVLKLKKYESKKVRCFGMPPDRVYYFSVCCTFSHPILEVRNYETVIFWDASGHPLRYDYFVVVAHKRACFSSPMKFFSMILACIFLKIFH
jgi:hypothetical protein